MDIFVYMDMFVYMDIFVYMDMFAMADQTARPKWLNILERYHGYPVNK